MPKITSGPLPDITPPQIVAMAVAGIPILASFLRAFGVYDLSDDEEQALSNAVSWAGVLAGSLIGGDALLRLGRNLRFGATESALAAGGEGDKLAIVDKLSNGSQTVAAAPAAPIPPAPPSTATTGFEEPPR